MLKRFKVWYKTYPYVPAASAAVVLADSLEEAYVIVVALQLKYREALERHGFQLWRITEDPPDMLEDRFKALSERDPLV